MHTKTATLPTLSIDKKSLKTLTYYFSLIGVISEIYFSYIDIFLFAPSNYFFSLAVIFAIPELKSKLTLLKKYWLPLATPFFLLGLSLCGDLIFDRQISIKQTSKVLLKFNLLLILFSTFDILEIHKFIKHLFYSIIPTLVIAIFQGIGIEFSWELRRLIDQESFIKLINYLRPSGLAFYFNTLAEHALLATPLSYYFYRKKKSLNSLFFLYLCFVSLLFTYTRSSILGFSCSILFLIFIDKKERKRHAYFLLSFISLILVFNFFTIYFADSIKSVSAPIDANQIKISRMGKSAGSRIYLFISGLEVLKRNIFFGLGSEYSNFVSYFKSLNISIPTVFNIPGKHLVYEHMPHNYFLNNGIKSGLAGLFLPIIALFSLITKLLKTKGALLSQFFMTTIIGLSISSFFHNSGIFNSTLPCMLIGLTVSYLASKENSTSHIDQ